MFRSKKHNFSQQSHQMIIHKRGPDFDGAYSASKSPFARVFGDDEGVEVDSTLNFHPAAPEDVLDYQW